MRTYTRQEALAASLPFFDNDEAAAEVLVDKYLMRNEKNERVESNPLDVHRRTAREFARIEAKYANPMSEQEIYSMFTNGKSGTGKIIPQGSPLSGIGNYFRVQSLSNCFVIGQPADSYGGILRSDQEEAQIMKRRGGVGFDISKIRPRGMATTNAANTTDGIGVFMQRFSNTCLEVAQNGRRGALMLTIDVRHPEIETFINIKRDKVKVTGANVSIRVTDDFMNAVVNDEEFTLRWPVESSIESAKFVKVVKARDVWEQMMDAAWFSAEPGILFWDNVVKRTPADIYARFGFNSISTNPCLTYDTKVAVADGRGSVEIGKLAEEGKDVPVYTCDNNGKIVVRTMRNPRLTGINVPILKVTIEGGYTFKATPNHKMKLVDGSIVEVKDLKSGDQLSIMKRSKRSLVHSKTQKSHKSAAKYYFIENSKSKKSEHRLIWESQNGEIPQNHVIHHVDFDSLNNSIENLRCMSFDDHVILHREDMLGDNNPMRRAKSEWSAEKWQSYHDNMSASVSGEKNGRAIDISNEDLFEHAVNLSRQLGFRFSGGAWVEYARLNNLPQHLVKFRLGQFENFENWSKAAAIKAGVSTDLVDFDPRLQRTIIQAHSMGYRVVVRNNAVFVERTCEECSKSYLTKFSTREISFCGASCSNKYANRVLGKNVLRTASLQQMHARKAEETRKQQLDIFTKLRFELNRDPSSAEWANECKNSNIPYRTGTKNGFKNWADIKENAQLHNHRVVSVEEVGFENVYNGTVDEFHSFYIGDFDDGNDERIHLLTMNCGEIVLSREDSCRLMVLDLTRFIDRPFQKFAQFNYGDFAVHVQKAQRLMDDLIDLEIEAVEKIIQKVESDEEDQDTKKIELDLWNRILTVAKTGRRTGLGVTGLGDAIAMLNVRYGSEESIRITEEIYRALALNAYRSTVTLAEERGAFPVFDYELEKDHEFILQIMNLDSDLKQRWQKFGRRNISLTTTAPVGSISMLTRTTSGIEPAFMLQYKRRKRMTSEQEALGIKPDFVDELGEKFQEFTVYHPLFKLWKDTTGLSDVEDSPYHQATSDNIDWINSVKIQAVAQKWICHSISKTCNLPRNISHKVVSDCYIEAWRSGCKGFTVYRDGSRSGILITNDQQVIDVPSFFRDIPKEEIEHLIDVAKKHSSVMSSKYLAYVNEIEDYVNGVKKRPSNIVESHAPRRPKSLKCDIHRVSVKGEQYLVLVGIYGGKPYEVFAGLSQHVEIPKKAKEGTLVKNGKNADGVVTYNLVIPISDDDEIIIKDVVTVFDNPTYGSFTRTISLALRHGVMVSHLVEQLRKDKHGDITSFANVIARVLSKNYIQEEELSYMKCQKCGSRNLVFEENCQKCLDCLDFKCN